MSNNLESEKKMIGHDFDVEEMKDILFCLDFTLKAITDQIPHMKECCTEEKFKEVYVNIERIDHLKDRFDLIIKTCEGDIPQSDYVC